MLPQNPVLDFSVSQRPSDLMPSPAAAAAGAAAARLSACSCACAGIGRVALDTRLGCLDPDLPADSEPQKIIDAAKFALRNVAILELKFPFWRYIPTPLWSHYVKNMNFFIE